MDWPTGVFFLLLDFPRIFHKSQDSLCHSLDVPEHCQAQYVEGGEIVVFHTYCTFYRSHNLKIKHMKNHNHLPGFFTMWNDIAGREKSRDSYKRKSGDNKESSNFYNFRFPFNFPFSRPCSLYSNKYY